MPTPEDSLPLITRQQLAGIAAETPPPGQRRKSVIVSRDEKTVRVDGVNHRLEPVTPPTPPAAA